MVNRQFQVPVLPVVPKCSELEKAEHNFYFFNYFLEIITNSKF